VPEYHILGRSDEALLNGMDRPWMRLLLKDIQDNPWLEYVPENFWLTDAAIAWWLEQNPGATTSATHLKFNILQPESSLVEEFTASKSRKNSSKYTAAMFDHRGYTVIVVFQKDDGNYVLAWAEPEAKDHYRDRLLNSIAFDDANTLAMSYYHGNRTFKYRLNLTAKHASYDMPGGTLVMTWDEIQTIILTKNSIVFLPKTSDNVPISLPISCEKEVRATLKKLKHSDFIA
jgi:hypothetical protein